MNCRAWEEPIALAAGGDLDGPSRLELERHLAECPPCREFARGMAECLASVSQVEVDGIAPAHYAAVRARVLDRLRSEPRGRFAWVWIAAATVALAVLAAWMVPWGRPDPPPPHLALARSPAAPLPGAVPESTARSVRRSPAAPLPGAVPESAARSIRGSPAPLLPGAVSASAARSVRRSPAPPLPGAAPRSVRHARPARPPEPLLVKIETDNPDVVIYWIAN